ncbi:hypothetical protein K8090_17370, partial [Halomonas meridiana]
ELTEALENLATAEQAKADFLEGIAPIDTDLNDTTGDDDGFEFEAGKATANDVESYYDNAAAKMATATNVSQFADRSDAVQDAAIAEAQADLEKTVTTKTAAAADNMSALLATVEAEIETVDAAFKAKSSTATELNAEIAAFENANSGVTVATDVIYDEDYDPSANNSGKLIISNGKAYTGEDGSSTAVALAGLTEDDSIVRVSQLESAYDADVAADEAITSAKEVLETAVGAVYLAESEGDSVASLGGAVSYVGDVATVDYTQAVSTYDTAADTTKGTGTKEAFTATFSAEADNAADTIIFDGVTTTLTGNETAAQVAAAVFADQDGAGADWVASYTPGNNFVTFTAATVGDKTDVTDAAFTGTYNEALTINVTTQGVDAGTTSSAAATKANELLTAENALETFLENKTAFEEARSLDDQLTALEDAVTGAKAAIENDVDDADAPGLGYTLKDFIDGATATSADDIYLFDADQADVTIGQFGAAGEDRLFFGSDYTFVELADGEAITDNVGDISTLEIFWKVETGNLKLWVEEETFAGNASSASDSVAITLTGVTADEFAVEDGFLTSGAVA